MKESKHQNNDKSVKPTRATVLTQPPGPVIQATQIYTLLSLAEWSQPSHVFTQCVMFPQLWNFWGKLQSLKLRPDPGQTHHPCHQSLCVIRGCCDVTEHMKKQALWLNALETPHTLSAHIEFSVHQSDDSITSTKLTGGPSNLLSSPSSTRN